MTLEELRRFALRCDEVAPFHDRPSDVEALAREARRRAASRAMARMVSSNGSHT